ncbi:tyrosine-type recombinase/integrase [Chryseobacterium sp.]|uniref:tyrosine-type recombinase/integrase n=1 Tax=Chryseobacterium sp. TaxID=1871047 RepID=UPI0011C903A6|nr:site-specific integrase [Chryseobacterium sp.]TXF75932.1 site-specific integrase [Chryseobacterium sp.]
MFDQFTIKYYFRETDHLRRADGTYPAQLAAYDKNTQKRAYILAPFYFSNKEEFNRTEQWQEVKKNKSKADWIHEVEIKPIKDKMEAYLRDAETKARSLSIFNFSEFRELMKRPKFAVGDSLQNLYDFKIAKLKRDGKEGTASNYDSSIKSIQQFIDFKRIKGKIRLHQIDAEFLNQYERWMKSNDKSGTTIGIYLRPLRSIFNDNADSAISYPFHSKYNKNGYKIPGSEKTNKSLDNADLKKLMEVIPENEDQEKAKAFWFFSYASNGMNIKDVAKLKYKNLSEDTFKFIRSKTENTTKEKAQVIEVVILDLHREIIKKYGNKAKTGYVFPIISGRLSPEDQRRHIQSFTRFINQHIKKIAHKAGITADISSNWARHSFATKLMNDNVSIEFIRQSLGHQKITTTQNYLSSFESKEKKKNAESLFNF